MVFIRISVLSRLLCAAAVLALPVLAATPAQGQFFTGFSNTRIASAGDMATGGKLNPRIAQLPGLNFSTLGLFGDAEVFSRPGFPRPFIYALPDFSGAGLDFNGVTFDEYLTLVANRFGFVNSSDYLTQFGFQNIQSITGNFLFTESPSLQVEFDGRIAQEINRLETQFGVTNLNDLPPELLPVVNAQFQSFRFGVTQSVESQAVVRLHQEDFLAGGGFFPLGGVPFTPTGTVGDSGGPVALPGPLTPLGLEDDDTGSTDTADDGELAADIAPVDDGFGDGSLGDGDTEFLAAASASQAQPTPAANVSVVPEPATLGLLAMGGFALLGRSRRG